MRKGTVTGLTIALLLAALVIFMSLGVRPAPAAQNQLSTLSSGGEGSTSYDGNALASAARTQLCTLSSSGQCSISFDLNPGDEVSGSISIQGNSAGETGFWVTNPSGINIYKADGVDGVTSFLFDAYTGGTYLMHFSSSPTTSNAGLLTLDYHIIHAVDC